MSEPGADLRMLVEEQAALKRVAVAVATESTAERVFDVVAEEVLACSAPTPRTSCRSGRARSRV